MYVYILLDLSSCFIGYKSPSFSERITDYKISLMYAGYAPHSPFLPTRVLRANRYLLCGACDELNSYTWYEVPPVWGVTGYPTPYPVQGVTGYPLVPGTRGYQIPSSTRYEGLSATTSTNTRTGHARHHLTLFYRSWHIPGFPLGSCGIGKRWMPRTQKY